MQILRLLPLFFFACLAIAGDGGPLLLEKAVHLETAAGNSVAAEEIYLRLTRSENVPHRVRAEATFRLAELYARQAKNADAKSLILKVVRDFPDATDLIPLAELELAKVTALQTRGELGNTNSSIHHLGDLAISIQGALENGERERASAQLQLLNTALDALTAGGKGPDVLLGLKTSAGEVTTVLHSGGSDNVTAALSKMGRSKEFEPFLVRGFASDPHDVFAPAWRMKDRVARAISAKNLQTTRDVTVALERYLNPLAQLPNGPREGALARLLNYAVKDIRDLAEAGKFAEARRRMDELDLDRHQQFPEVRVIATLPSRMPEQAVSAAWAILLRTDLARRDLSKRAYATAMDHVAEAANVCRDIQPRVENTEAAALFKKQLDALELALWEIRNDRLGPAQMALRRVTQP